VREGGRNGERDEEGDERRESEKRGEGREIKRKGGKEFARGLVLHHSSSGATSHDIFLYSKSSSVVPLSEV